MREICIADSCLLLSSPRPVPFIGCLQLHGIVREGEANHWRLIEDATRAKQSITADVDPHFDRAS
jgi:hypothetical protein